jgi:hypothetical protein
MKRPTWITVVGVLGILFGIFGLFASGQVAAMPTITRWQNQTFESMPMPQSANEQQNVEQFRQVMRGFFGDQPSWFGPASMALGVVGLAVNGFDIFASVSLLQVKPNSARLFSTVLGVSIALGVVRTMVMMNGFSFMAIPMLMSGLVGVVLDIILVVVIATNDKSVFAQPSTA